MKHRIVLVACLLGVIGGGAGAALAAPHAGVNNHNICVAYAENQDYKHAQYYCVSLP